MQVHTELVSAVDAMTTSAVDRMICNKVSPPGAARRYARRRWQFDGRDGSPHMAKLQAASVPIA